jgi:hypothetical protein
LCGVDLEFSRSILFGISNYPCRHSLLDLLSASRDQLSRLLTSVLAVIKCPLVETTHLYWDLQGFGAHLCNRCAHWFCHTEASAHLWAPEIYASFATPTTITRIISTRKIDDTREDDQRHGCHGKLRKSMKYGATRCAL